MTRKRMPTSPLRPQRVLLCPNSAQARSVEKVERELTRADRVYVQGLSRLMTPAQRRRPQALRGRDRADFLKQGRIDVRALQKLKRTRVQTVQRAWMSLYPARMPTPRKAR